MMKFNKLQIFFLIAITISTFFIILSMFSKNIYTLIPLCTFAIIQTIMLSTLMINSVLYRILETNNKTYFKKGWKNENNI